MNKIFYVLILTSLSFMNLLSQELDPSEYKTELNQLREKKADLLSEKSRLQEEISEMLNKIKTIDSAIEDAEKNNVINSLIKKYGKKDGQNLALGRIWKGMTKQMMIDIWGEPDRQNTNKFSYGVFTQFYYGKITYFFRDGKLTEWEETE